ncbi:hypothetical protein MIR68_001783 [Amoeboaphelidium protococcarum]|nr:hypothetical protein MIR68_001783 [Amoeboaphelidium protococcarum]
MLSLLQIAAVSSLILSVVPLALDPWMIFQQPDVETVWTAGKQQYVNFSLVDAPSVDTKYRVTVYNDGSGFLRILPDRIVGKPIEVTAKAGKTKISVPITLDMLDVRQNDELYYVAVVNVETRQMLRSDLFRIVSFASGQRRYEYRGNNYVKMLYSPREFSSVKAGQNLTIAFSTDDELSQNKTLRVDLCKRSMRINKDDVKKVANGTIVTLYGPLKPFVEIVWTLPERLEANVNYAICFYAERKIIGIFNKPKLIYQSGMFNIEMKGPVQVQYKPNETEPIGLNAQGEFIENMIPKFTAGAQAS